MMMRMIFPHHVRAPSQSPSSLHPNRQIDYDTEDVVGFDQYERYLRREVPRAVRRRLEVAAAAIAVPVENELRAQLVDIIRSAQAEAFDGFRRMIGQHSTRPDMALFPSESIASIIAAPALSNSVLTANAGESRPQRDDTMSQYIDFSAYTPEPVMDGRYVMPETVVPGSPSAGLFRDFTLPAPDSGYGSNTGLQNGKKPVTSLEDWDGGPQIDGSSNWWMPAE